MQRSLPNRMWQAFLKFLARSAALVYFRIRYFGEENIPTTGGGLLLSNHQSHLDPLVVGMCSARRLNYVARKTLFRFPPFRWLINSLDAISIDRDGTGFGGLKETLKRLKRGELVLLFPEGTRTPDGEVQSIKPGFCAIAHRSGVPIVPVAMDGTYESWPRQRTFPRPAVVHVWFGPPISPAEIQRMNEDELVREVERRIRVCRAQALASRQRAGGLHLAATPAGDSC